MPKLIKFMYMVCRKSRALRRSIYRFLLNIFMPMKAISLPGCVCVVLLMISAIGCENSRREYLLALERHDRCIEQAHVARRELIDSLTNGNFRGTEQASKLQISVQEQSMLTMYALDRYRPRKPDPVVFQEASEQVERLEAQRIKLQSDFDDAYATASAEKALQVSKKIRDLEIELFNASEKMKQAKLTDHSPTNNSNSEINADGDSEGTVILQTPDTDPKSNPKQSTSFK